MLRLFPISEQHRRSLRFGDAENKDYLARATEGPLEWGEWGSMRN